MERLKAIQKSQAHRDKQFQDFYQEKIAKLTEGQASLTNLNQVDHNRIEQTKKNLRNKKQELDAKSTNVKNEMKKQQADLEAANRKYELI